MEYWKYKAIDKLKDYPALPVQRLGAAAETAAEGGSDMLRCSEKAFARCPSHDLCRPIESATFTEDSECAAFNREVEDKPTTNADRIRVMSDEELAKFLAGFDPHCCNCPADDVCGGCLSTPPRDCTFWFEDWLHLQPVEEV